MLKDPLITGKHLSEAKNLSILDLSKMCPQACINGIGVSVLFGFLNLAEQHELTLLDY